MPAQSIPPDMIERPGTSLPPHARKLSVVDRHVRVSRKPGIRAS